jgi:hypothetical protein
MKKLWMLFLVSFFSINAALKGCPEQLDGRIVIASSPLLMVPKSSYCFCRQTYDDIWNAVTLRENFKYVEFLLKREKKIKLTVDFETDKRGNILLNAVCASSVKKLFELGANANCAVSNQNGLEVSDYVFYLRAQRIVGGVEVMQNGVKLDLWFDPVVERVTTYDQEILALKQFIKNKLSKRIFNQTFNLLKVSFPSKIGIIHAMERDVKVPE